MDYVDLMLLLSIPLGLISFIAGRIYSRIKAKRKMNIIKDYLKKEGK